MQPRLNSASQVSYVDPSSNEKIVEETTAHTDQRKTDALYVLCILIMLAWPWIFFGVVSSQDGIPAGLVFGTLVTDNPQITNFIVTLIGTLVRIIVGYLFTKAVLRYSQKWVTENSQDITLFHLSLMSAFKSRQIPWGLADRKYLSEQNRWLRVILVGVCIGAFVIVPSGITSLINPVPFDRIALVLGTEIDLTSNDTDCLDWINNVQLINDECDWAVYHGTNYTNCLGEFQSFDLLESGRSNILSSVTNNSESVYFEQLGTKAGLQFTGPIRGVLPAGPDGHPAADPIEIYLSSVLRDNTAILSYNYTLELQGLSTSVSCKYDDKSPIVITGSPDDLVLQFGGSCDGQVDIFTNSTFLAYNSSSTLTFWACKSPPNTLQDQSYYIYLQGTNGYENQIGNITCTVSPTLSAKFPLTYRSASEDFTAATATSFNAFTTSEFIDQSVAALENMLEEAQNLGSNQVVEFINTLAVEIRALPVNTQSNDYLPFYEAIIQGFLEYLATYSRVLYSSALGRPSSCDRDFEGKLSYRMIGWKVKSLHIGTLIPMTIVNLASLLLILAAIFKTRVDSYASDLTDVRSLALANLHPRQGARSGWDDGVTYRQREDLRVNSMTD